MIERTLSCLTTLLVLLWVLVFSADAAAATERFNDLTADAERDLATAVGVWRGAGDAAVIRHPKTGDACLHLRGGADRAVELRLPPTAEPSAALVLDAERWTARNPFRFRVEARVGDNWRTIYTGDDEVAVGGLNTRVRIALPEAGVDRLRFVASSPDNSGVLIDNVVLQRRGPLRVIGVRATRPQVPVLRGGSPNDSAFIDIDVDGSEGALEITGVELDLTGATLQLEDIAGVEIHVDRSGDDKPEADGVSSAFGAATPRTRTFTIVGRHRLVPGTNRLRVSLTLDPDADIDGRIAVTPMTVTTGAGDRRRIEPVTGEAQRVGVALRRGGDDGVAVYRIPGLVTTNAGTLVAVYDIRHDGWADLPGHIDVGMSRSTDGGRTWAPMRTIMDMGADRRWRGDGVGDPAVLVDRDTGTIWVAALWTHGNRGWNGSGPGLTPEQTGQLLLVRSDDDGATWSEPINITRQVKDPGWRLLLQGPGRGITTADGTLVFAAQYRDADGLPHSTILYSRDHGESWEIGAAAYPDTTEAQVVELEPGVLMLNCRYNRANRRVVMVTRDLGRTWTEHPTSRKALVEPGACMASLIRLRTDGQPGPWLAFSNPLVEQPPRRRMTIRLSRDLGATWPRESGVLLDERPSAGYSCMTQIDEYTIGILYEGSGAHMTFQRIPIADLIDADRGADAP